MFHGKIVGYDGNNGIICKDGANEELSFTRQQWRAFCISGGDVKFAGLDMQPLRLPRPKLRVVFSVRPAKGGRLVIEKVGLESEYNNYGRQLMRLLRLACMLVLSESSMPGWVVHLRLRPFGYKSKKRVQQALSILEAEGLVVEQGGKWHLKLSSTGVRRLVSTL